MHGGVGIEFPSFALSPKPCFLYFAIFSKDNLIYADKLVELCVVEGFLKVEEMKSTEEVAEKCLKELADRCLISTVLYTC